MNEKERKPKALTLEETVNLLGAEEPQDTGPVRLDPIGMQILATRVAERLAGKRGRPTDQSWEISRKIPMKQVTWDSLREIADQLRADEVHVAPGQMGAIALELGVRELRGRSRRTVKATARRVASTPHVFHRESEEEARVLCPVIAEENLW